MIIYFDPIQYSLLSTVSKTKGKFMRHILAYWFKNRRKSI